MGLRRERNYCYAEGKPCTAWALLYFKDCLCNIRDGVSFGLGLLSVTCWTLADIPQIVTNFKAKSSQGVSLLLLLTWILGDVFNLAGCILEPTTLPTQLYTAVLYTVGSALLLSQCIYYDHIVPWSKKKGMQTSQVVEALEEAEHLIAKSLEDAHGAHQVPRNSAYYTSARSLATSPSASPSNSCSIINQSRRVATTVARYEKFVAAAASLPNQARAYYPFRLPPKPSEPLTEVRPDPYGQIMGWGMAVIYIGGRLPQIWLNMKRGNVEGLNPLMFVFALVGSIAYVLSILVRSCKWVDIKANMPWLFDSAVCVSLDLFILLQFIYYQCKRSKRKHYGNLPEARDILA